MLKKFFKKIRNIILWIFAIHIAYTLFIWVFNPPITATMIGSLLRGDGLKRDYVTFEQAGKHAPLAVIASEDQLFATHWGFDMKGIQKAMEYNEKKTGKIRGGSTISQQVAKNVFLWQGRSYFRKALEAYCTFWIELIYSKRRILELYLNVAEMGEGIYGIEAAAQHYFKKPAAKLTANEAASIVACLPAPRRYKASPASAYIKRRAQWIQRQMRQLQGDPLIDEIIVGSKKDKK